MNSLIILAFGTFLMWCVSLAIANKSLESRVKEQTISDRKEHRTTERTDNSTKTLYRILAEHHRARRDLQKFLQLKRQRRSSTDQNVKDLNEQALCSWEYDYDYNRSRVPRYIQYAKCTSAQCNLGFLGLHHDALHSLHAKTCCIAVKTDIPVYNNKRLEIIEGVPTACVCARKITQDSSLSRHLPAGNTIALDHILHGFDEGVRLSVKPKRNKAASRRYKMYQNRQRRVSWADRHKNSDKNRS